jgi:signal transduction histidine kinase/ActR/RegA family two-component response regulator
MPLQRRLMTIMLLTSGAVLGLACIGFSAYELITFRSGMVRQLSTIAELISSNSTAVLAFEDDKGADEILSALKAEPHVTAAALYGSDGKLFSRYPVSLPASAFPPAPAADGYRFELGGLIGLQPVVQGARRLGTLYIKSDTEAFGARLRLYSTVAGLTAAVAFVMAYLMSRMLQGQISRPILALVDSARRVSDHRDYNVRAKKEESVEMGHLTDAFNHMLAHIQDQMGRLELLNRITQAIGERLDLPSIYQVISITLEENLPVDFVCICQYDDAARKLTVANVGPKSAPLADRMGMAARAAIPVDQNGLARCVRGQLVYEPDISEVGFPFPESLASAGLGSLVLSPLVVESRVFGVLAAARRGTGAFSSAECEFLRHLSKHAALASHQANLYGALQQAYEELRQSQQTVLQQERLRALGQMASGIAHDINNAISPVALYTDFLIEKEQNLSPRGRENLQVIAHAVEDVAATVARLREFYRQREPDAGLAPVQLDRTVRQVIELTRARWHDIPQQRGLVYRIDADLPSDLPAVMGVEAEIREALTNLFFNAFDAMPEGGVLSLRARRRKEEAVLEVADTGVGMDEETRRRCLEPFYTTKGERGTGLGLAMVYGVMQRHNAGVEIESEPGKGTTIRLAFPIPEIAAVPARKEAVKPPPMELLVVDDDPVLLKSLCDALTGDGHAVVSANGGKLGIEAFQSSVKAGQPFDAVITDLGMPYVDGRKVAAAVHEAMASTPVLLLTGWGQRMLAEGEIPPYVARVLSKPPKLSELREALAGVAKPA